MNQSSRVGDPKFWNKLINQEGADKAFTEIIRYYKKNHIKNAHSSIHLLGKILYEKLGMDAINICDDSFAYACFHGVFISVIEDKGIRNIDNLEKACNKVSNVNLDCQHGIGHGILEYEGHEKLVKSLDVCETLIYLSSRFSCENGVFMEYNFPAITEGNGQINSLVRPFDQKSPYGPCLKIPDKYIDVCYYSAPQWWRSVLNNDYQKMGNLCDKVEDVRIKQNCYVGIGIIAAPFAEYEFDNLQKLCKKMPDPTGRDYCLLGAFWGVDFSLDYSELAIKICAFFSSESKSYCSYSFQQFIKKS